MAVRVPDLEELKEISTTLGLGLSGPELADFQGAMQGLADSYRRVEELAEKSAPKPDRAPTGRAPKPEENRLNAWTWRCEIEGRAGGLLAGKRFAIKDNVSVAGLPTLNGSTLLEGWVPTQDATVVKRILEAGGTIVGKAGCENLCFSGGSHTCTTGPIRNPWDEKRTAGGSSGGSGALVAAGEVDGAIGGDQGGSIRIPAAFCGIFGLKPTHGLVPYTGAFPIETTIDHLGPMTRTVADAAAMLEAIAGEDGYDPRQPPGLEAPSFTKLLDERSGPLRVGVVNEGFAWPGLSEPEVDDAVRAAAERLGKAGARVSQVTVPMHRFGADVWNPIAVEGAVALMLRGAGGGWNTFGAHDPALRAFFSDRLRSRASELSRTVKLVWLFGEFVGREAHGVHYSHARNLAFGLRRAYDEALEQVDLLVMPTLPIRASVIPPADAPLDEYLGRALEMIPNTAPFDVTGHPAATVPCGTPGGLPVGMMLVGRRYDDATVLRGARLYEDAVGGFPPAPKR